MGKFFKIHRSGLKRSRMEPAGLTKLILIILWGQPWHLRKFPGTSFKRLWHN